MHAGLNFKLGEAIIWTRRDIFKFVLIASITCVAYELLDLKWLAVPWLPMALIGTAVAFLIGFKNNASYDRTWEARKIYGAIVNSSRIWAVMSRDFVSNLHAEEKLEEKELNKLRSQLVHRHIAWLTALRYQLRQPRIWEGVNRTHNREYQKRLKVEELESNMVEALKGLISDHELDSVVSKKNAASQLLSEQSKQLKSLIEAGQIDDFRHMEMQNVIKDLYVHMGKCERIKNFPYPRQFATLNKYFVWLFLMLLPLGMIAEFESLGKGFVWLTIPFSTMVSWVFMTMERIGEASENPFEGGPNDTPITNLSRTIEIDLREMLDESGIPSPTQAQGAIVM